MPASFEKSPRLTPVMRAAAKPAPSTASKSKAQRTIVTITSGTIVMLRTVIARATRRYAPAMKGTMTATTVAMRVTPPQMTSAVRAATAIPTPSAERQSP